MLAEERHRHILEKLAGSGKVLMEDLTAKLRVSSDTVRRDLIQLEHEGRLVRVHGGAISVSFNTPFQPQTVYAQKEKIQIARKALSLIRDGMTLLLGGGTVMLEFARLLPENLKGTLFTVSPLVALEAAQRSSVDVILLSGKLSRNSYICTGAQVITQLEDVRADLCLMGANGFSVKDGVTDFDWEVTHIKKAMIARSDRVALLSITEKMATAHKLRVCPMRAVDYLITERTPKDPALAGFQRHCKVM